MSDKRIATFLGVSQPYVSDKRREYNRIRGIEKNKEVIVQRADGTEEVRDISKITEAKNKSRARQKPIIPEEQLALDSIEKVELVNPDNIVTIVDEILDSDIKLKLGDKYGNETLTVTFDKLDVLSKLDSKSPLAKEKFNLVVYSSSIDWITDNQKIIIDQPNVIIQGFSGEDINRIQNVETLANTFNIFIVASKIFVLAYFCPEHENIPDRIFSSYQEYLESIVSPYIEKDNCNILLVDPLEPVAKTMSDLASSAGIPTPYRLQIGVG